MRHTFAQTWSGLRRNLTMTIAVIVTMWVSLSLFGAGLLANQQVDLMKGRWYDKIEISVFLCTTDTKGDNCEPGQEVSQPQKAQIEQTLRTNPEVADVFFESKQVAYDEFRKAYEGSPIQDSLTVDQMQESYRVKLKNPEQYQGVVSAVAGLPGVQAVQDLHKVLDRLFQWLGLLQWGTIIASGLLLLAAALQIGNTIRMAAFARRREIGIMRLVRTVVQRTGYQELSYEQVATEAGVSRPSLYRRSASKALLVVRALVDRYGLTPVPEVGGIEDELLALQRAQLRLYNDPVFRRLRDPHRAAAQQRVPAGPANPPTVTRHRDRFAGAAPLRHRKGLTPAHGCPAQRAVRSWS